MRGRPGTRARSAAGTATPPGTTAGAPLWRGCPADLTLGRTGAARIESSGRADHADEHGAPRRRRRGRSGADRRAFVLAFFVTPTYVERLPGDTDVTRSYTGSFKTLLDAQEVAKGNLLSAVKRDVPMAVERTVKVLDTTDDTALVSDSRTTTAAYRAVEKTTWQYAVDRKTLEATTDHPSGWTVVDAKGLTVSWPIGAKKQTYTGWRPETGTTTPLTYTRTESRSGVSTYVYLARLPATRITDAQVLAGLPPPFRRAPWRWSPRSAPSRPRRSRSWPHCCRRCPTPSR
ncbi:porin PorA family protein [Kitasatospora arboriphila]